MEKTVIIKNQKGKKIPLTTELQNNDIVITKKNDKSPESTRKKIVIHVMDSDKYEEFRKIELKKNLNFYDKIVGIFTNLQRNI